MVRTIGIHTVNVLFERAIWEASQRHPELALIEHTDDGLSFEALEKSYADRPESEVAEAFGDLSSELLLILARLLGKEMAQRLSEELQAKMAREARSQKGKKAGR
jgi:Mg/Co/Ni transporter MgtE